LTETQLDLKLGGVQTNAEWAAGLGVRISSVDVGLTLLGVFFNLGASWPWVALDVDRRHQT